MDRLPRDTENKWTFLQNDVSNKIKQFLRFCEKSPDEVILLDMEEIQRLLLAYSKSLWGKNAESTVISKIESVIYFFEVNEIQITGYEDELYPPQY